jgi:ATP-dependent helicase/nuclease subunit B
MADSRPSEPTFYTGGYRALEKQFISHVKHLRSTDPLRPLIVIVTSRLLGLHLARMLPEYQVFHINIRFFTLEDLAHRIAVPGVLGRGKRPAPAFVPPMAMAEALRRVASGRADFYFSGIADRPGFHEAMLATIRDLEEGIFSPEDLERATRSRTVRKVVHLKKIADLARVWREYRTLLDETDWIDTSQVMHLAADHLPTSPLMKDVSSILVYGFYDLNALQKMFFERCFETRDTTFFVPFEDLRAFEFAQPILRWIKSKGFTRKSLAAPRTSTESPALAHLRDHLFEEPAEFADYRDAVTFISAPGEAREVREIARLITAEEGNGIASHEVGIMLRDSGSYGGLLRDTLDHLGLNPYLPEGKPLSQTVDGRTMLLLIEILVRDYARKEVMEFVTFADLKPEPLQRENGEQVSVHRWDAASMAAGIVEGAEEWEERLGRLLGELTRGHDEDARNGLYSGVHPFEAEDVLALIRFMRELTALLGAVRKAKTWTGKANLLVRAFQDLTGPGDSGDRVAEAVGALGELDQVASPSGVADLRRVVADLLEGESIRTGRFERQGPAVLSLEAARGIPFKMVVIPGMVEKAFPPVIRQDAILLDHEREALNKAADSTPAGPLHLRSARRLEEERLLFHLAAGAASQNLVLSYPRLATGTARECLPSSFLLAAVEALAGRKVYFDTVENTGGFVRVPLVEIAATAPDAAIDQAEFELATTLEGIRASTPESVLYMRRESHFFPRGLRLEASRWGSSLFTAYDGMLTGAEAKRLLKTNYAVVDSKVSPTRLEVYAGCPFAYLLRVILEIDPLEEPERASTISPVDRGELVHSILWEFFTSLKESKPEPLSLEPEDRALLQEIALRRFKTFESRAVVGYPVMWELEKEDILRYLGAFLEEEIARNEMHPAYFEVRYGMRKHTSQDSEISTDRPVPFSFGNRKMLFRGRIDRIDVSKDGRRIRVVDYKTGRARAKPDDFQGGTTLQLPLYLYAAKYILKDRYPEIKDLHAEYFHLAEQSASKRHIGFSGDNLVLKSDQLNSILDTIADGIEGGLFFPLPSGDCRWCDFESVCTAYYRRIYESKRGDPRVARFLRMRGEIEAEPDEGDTDA